MTVNNAAKGGFFRRGTPARKAGCGIALVLWFLLLLSPCFLLTLASQGEIAIQLGSAPNQSLRLWLISEADARGVVLSSPSVNQSSDNAVCVQTQTRFFVWAGRAESDVYYCECYQRDSTDAEWSLISAETGTCGTASE